MRLIPVFPNCLHSCFLFHRIGIRLELWVSFPQAIFMSSNNIRQSLPFGNLFCEPVQTKYFIYIISFHPSQLLWVFNRQENHLQMLCRLLKVLVPPWAGIWPNGCLTLKPKLRSETQGCCLLAPQKTTHTQPLQTTLACWPVPQIS